MTLQGFLAPPGALDGAAVGGALAAGGEVAGHAVRVRRMTPGQSLQLVDGAGLRVTGELTAASPDRITMHITDIGHEEAGRPALVLVQALAKGERDLAAIEAATEVGVDAVVPWAAQRSIVDWPANKAAKSRAKWHNTLVAASLQSRRARVPELLPLVRGTKLADTARADDAWIVLHESATAGLARTLRALPGAGTVGTRAAGPARIVLVVGPEGGITDAELAALHDAGAVAAVLGPTVLRASTAGPVALGLCQTALGRWA